MNNRLVLTGIALGLATALLSLAPLRVPSIGFLLSTFASLPIFLAGLGFGSACALVAGIAAVVAAFIFGQGGVALSVAFMSAIPGVIVAHMATMSRPAGDDPEAQEIEWFPLETILFRITLYAAGLVIVIGLLTGFTTESAGELIVEVFNEAAKRGAFTDSGLQIPDGAQLAVQAEYLAKIIPILTPASLLILFVLNMALAARTARGFGWAIRARDYLPAATALPLNAAGIFAVAIVLMLIGGTPGLAGKALAGAFGTAFALVGLATLHFILRNENSKFIMLFAVYAAIFLIAPVVLVFTVLGLAETLLGLRARHAARSSPPKP